MEGWVALAALGRMDGWTARPCVLPSDVLAPPPRLSPRPQSRVREVLDRPVESINGVPGVKLDNADIRFVPDADGRGTGIRAIDVLPANRDNILAMADKMELRQGENQIMLCGVLVNLV